MPIFRLKKGRPHEITPRWVIFRKQFRKIAKNAKLFFLNQHINKKNLAWVQSPGIIALLDQTQWPRLQTYVKDVVGTYANDARVLGWDLWNEPGNSFNNDFNATQNAALEQLLPQVFEWALSVDPTQPVTSGLWGPLTGVLPTIQINNSDIMSFHK